MKASHIKFSDIPVSFLFLTLPYLNLKYAQQTRIKDHKNKQTDKQNEEKN